MTNNEINSDTREARLVPRLCKRGDDSSSSSSSDSSGEEDSNDETELPGGSGGVGSGGASDGNGTSTDESYTASSSGGSGSGGGSGGDNNSTRRKRRRARRAKSKQRKKRESKWTTYWNRYMKFVHSPRVHFVYDAMFYCVFLFLFSYWILCEYEYEESVESKSAVTLDSTINGRYARFTDSNSTNRLNNSTTSTRVPIQWNLSNLTTHHTRTSTLSHHLLPVTTNSPLENNDELEIEAFFQRVVKKPSWIEWLLIYWMVAFAAEEARQVVSI